MMKVHGFLGEGIKRLRELYSWFMEEEELRDKVLAHSAYTAVLKFVADHFGVDEWYIDTLRACNDVIVED